MVEPSCRPVTSQVESAEPLTSLNTTAPESELRTDERVVPALASPTDIAAAAAHVIESKHYDKMSGPGRTTAAGSTTTTGCQKNKPEPPGSKATSVCAEHLLNSQIRWLLSSPSVSLRRFFHSTFASQASRCESCSLRSVWPLPLPSRRGRGTTAADQCLNSMVVVLNWLHLGQPCKVPSNYSASSKLTGEQRGIVFRLRRLSEAFVKSPEITAADMGRSAAKVEHLEEILDQMTKEVAAILGSTGSHLPRGGYREPDKGFEDEVPEMGTLLEQKQFAKPIEADRLKFGGRPSFQPAELLESHTRSIYEDPLFHAMPVQESQEKPPRVTVRGHRKEILRLLHQLDATDRLAIFTRAEIRMSHRSGLFCLMKSQEADRLIMDARPPNLLEDPLSSFTQTMAGLSPLLELVVAPDEKVRAAGEDLKDYYYYYQVSRSRAARNALAFQLSPSEAKQFRAFRNVQGSDSCYVPALATMAMGDLNSVEFGQQAHVMLAALQGFVKEDFLTMRGKWPRQNWAIGIIIDDFVVVEKMNVQQDHSLLSGQLADVMVEAYLRYGLQPNDKKRFRDNKEASFWGITLDGDSCLVRTQLERTVPIAFVTAKVARLGCGSRKLLEMLAGAWISILQCRRRTMCLLSSIFSDIQAHPYGRSFRLAGETIDELWSLVILCPLFCSDLRAQPSEELSLVDASGTHRAEVVTKLPMEFAAELHRHRLTKAAWTRLLSPFRAWQRLHGRLDPRDEVPPGEVVSQAHPLWTTMAKVFQFHTKQVHTIKERTHINVSELKAALEAESRRARVQPSSRPHIAADSQVALGALVKGRSSSRGLNSLLKRFLPQVLCYNVYTGWQYLGTHDNVADDPTRFRPCRDPVQTPPDWLTRALTGDFALLDEFLEDNELDDATLARVPELPSMPKKLAVEPPVRALRRRAWRRKRPTRTGLETKQLINPPVAACIRAEPWMPKTVLTTAATEMLRPFSADQFVTPSGDSTSADLTQAGHLDLFSGCRVAAQKLAQRTGKWVLCFDLKHHPSEDLLDHRLQAKLEHMLRAGCFLSLTAGPVCASFSRAICPPVRTAAEPLGIQDMTDSMRKKVEIGNAMANWVAAAVEICLELGITNWTENPAGSFLWRIPSWSGLISKYQLQSFYTDYCRWGTPWRKRTRFYGRFGAAGMTLLCECGRPHVKLRGYSREHKMSWTKAAEGYPPRLAGFLATAVAESLKPVARRRTLDPASCAKASSKRVGEAQNPGPRLRSGDRGPGDLESISLVRPATQMLQQRVHERFIRWLSSELSTECMESLGTCPRLQLHFLRAFGNWLYQQGDPIYLYRHLVVYLQQMYPTDRPILTGAWELLSKWESLRPVNHKPPLPKLVLDAFISIGLLWGWERWCAVTLLAYHGATRTSEPLQARRSDLVLPEDSGIERDVCFLRVNAPKPGRRGRGRVQHARISDRFTVKLAQRILGPLQPDQLLYPASSSSYRRRWNKLLEELEIGSELRLTPGCVRGGGAVFLYHNEVAVMDILWRLRLRHLGTLEHYLQEVGAVNLVQQLSAKTRAKVVSASGMLPYIAQSLFP